MDIAAAVGVNGVEMYRRNGPCLKIGQSDFTQLSESHGEVCSSVLHQLKSTHHTFIIHL